MSPYNEYRKSYITACLVTAVIYAFVTGINLPAIVCMTDGFIYTIILFTAGIILWNTFRFAIPVSYSPKYRIILLSIFICVSVLFVTGVETFALYICFPSSISDFVPTLPVRIVITLLLFIIIYLFYLYYCENVAENRLIQKKMQGKEPMDSPKTGENGLFTLTNDPATPLDRITVRSGQKIKIIPVDSIIYIKADGDYITIHTAEGKWLKEQTMKYTENRLPANNFIRIHRSFIVNIHQISRIERYGEKQLIVLHNNEKIKISAARYQLLKQILGI